MIRLLSIVLAASLALPGCMTSSAIQPLRDPDRAVPHAAAVLVGANVIGGAIVGGIAAAQPADDAGDRAIHFAQGMAAWNMLDLFVGLPLFAIGVARDKLDE